MANQSGRRAPKPTLAPLGARFLGALVDGLILLAGTLIFGLWQRQLYWVWIAPAALYHIVPVALWGRTPGKRAAGTRIVRASDAGPVGWRSASVRHLILAASAWIGRAVPVLGPVSLFGLFDLGALVVRKDRRALHDLAAGTMVVNSE